MVATLGAVLLVGCSPERVDAESFYDKTVATYVHGMTAPVAQRLVGPHGASLNGMLDGEHPRPDNVVALLAFTGNVASVDRLVALTREPLSVATPQMRRARLFAPVALGQLAAQGEPAALDALVELSRELDPEVVEPDMILQGLAWSGADEALDILDAMQSTGSPTWPGADASAARALRTAAAHRGDAQADSSQAAAADTGASELAESTESVAGLSDTEAAVDESMITYTNHVDTAGRIDESEVVALLELANGILGRADSESDVACCAGMGFGGTHGDFGTPGDGLQVPFTQEQLDAVLGDPYGRVHVIDGIGWCSGGPAINVIGCARTGGHGMAVVRQTLGPSLEATLWAHEFGHNTGLAHSSVNTNIMYFTISGATRGVDRTECDTFHHPHRDAEVVSSSVADCIDGDDDAVHDWVDNCPGTSNWDQYDADGNGVGEACEGACGNGVVDVGEECDAFDLGGMTCADLGWVGGDLACTGTCTLDQAGCDNCVDGDGDGWTGCDGDCDDADGSIHPGAAEVCKDGIDQDCDGTDPRKGCGNTGGGSSEDCRDGVDNDGDGDVDCADSQCASKGYCHSSGPLRRCHLIPTR